MKKIEEIKKLEKYKQKYAFAKYYKSINPAFNYDKPFLFDVNT